MLSYSAKSKLADLIGSIAENERQLEVRRQLLADEPSFSPYLAFARADKLYSGSLTPYDLKEFMRDNGMFITTSEAENLIKLFGDSIRSRMYREDFLDLVLSANIVLKSRALDRDKFLYSPLSVSAELPLARVFQAAIDGNNKVASEIATLRTLYNCSVYDAFREIDKYRSGYVTLTDLSLFLQANGHLNRFDDAELFIRHLDRNKDGRLSYSEFVNGLEAMEQKGIDTYTKYSYSEKKPSYRSRFESPAPRSEYRPYARRFGSEERSSGYQSRFRSSYISPAKTRYESPYRKPAPYFSPSKTLYTSFVRESNPIVTKLEYSKTLSPSKRREHSFELANVMEEQLGYERRFEQAKEELALRFDFNLVDAFKVFDWNDKGFTTMSEFYDGMKDLGVAATYSEISQLFKRLDTNGDGKVRYSDYRGMLTPKVRDYELMMAGRRPYGGQYLSRPSLAFTSQTCYLYRNALEIALSHEGALEMARQRLKRNVLFSAYDAFDTIDVLGKGYISSWELKDFLAGNKIYAEEAELKSLMEKYDHNQDGRISLSEFVDELSLKSGF